MQETEPDTLFDALWDLYPVKKGKGRVSYAARQRLLKVGREEMTRAIDRYKAELEKESDWRKPQNGSTFFTSGYIDYLDANYVPSAETKGRKRAGGFVQRDRTGEEMLELEKKLLNKI